MTDFEQVLFSSRVADFENRLFDPRSNVLDPEGVHHEFSQGLHGRKADLDAIIEDTYLYDEWIDINTAFVADEFGLDALQNAVLVGVANGTNRVARDVSRAFDRKVPYIETFKNEQNLPELTWAAIDFLGTKQVELAIVLEDVITRGTNSAATVLSLQKHRPESLRRIEVVGTLQRGMPERLIELNVPYHAIIKHLMKDFTPEECGAAPDGFCKQGWELIPYKSA